MQTVSSMVDKYLNMDVSSYAPGDTAPRQSNPHLYTAPLLGGNEPFGLWITVRYNGQNFSKKVDIKRWTILGKLTDPDYRTPIRFNVDNDPEDDIECGFGFFRYGIDEKQGSGTVDHKAWANRFDILQINNGLSNETAGLEVWQEFHVNLNLIGLGAQDQSYTPGQALLHCFLLRLESLLQRLTGHAGLVNMMDSTRGIGSPAAQDYIVLRVGYRSPVGEKIPVHVEKTFSVGREDIFHPAIFQHEMDSYDIIGTSRNDFMFGFQAFKEGAVDPAYNIEFYEEFNPACSVVTQLVPRSGKAFFSYDDAAYGPLSVTFGSNLLSGGNASEQENASFTFTLAFATVTPGLVGLGKWMSFDLNALHDHSPFDGSFSYRASDKFDVSMILSSPWFKEKIRLGGIPTEADVSWALNASFTFEQGTLLDVDTTGYLACVMNDDLDQVAVYYPQNASQTKDVAWMTISDIPSSRRVEAGASLYIENSTMVTVTVGGYVGHDMSDSLGEIAIYYPKPDPESDPDIRFVYIPAGSLAGSGQVDISGTLYVDPDPDHFWTNTGNYLYAQADRSASSNFHEADMYLPGVDIPLLRVNDIPSNAYGSGQFWWNQLQGQLYASRSSAGAPDPIQLAVTFGDLFIGNMLQIGDGSINVQGQIASSGYFSLDSTNQMLSDVFEIANNATGQRLSIEAGTIDATDFSTSWVLNTTTNQTKIQDLNFAGRLAALRNFHVAIGYNGDQLDFTGDWSIGDSGALELDFTQDEPIVLGFNMDNDTDNIAFHGSIILSNTLHFDMSWKWAEGSYTDPAYFRINQNCSDPNIEAMNLYFTYHGLWGANVTLTGLSLYVCVEWYWQNLQLYIWPVFSVTGDLTLNLLLNGVWYEHVEDNWP